MVNGRRDRGLSLVEVVLAVALFSICAVGMLGAMTQGASTAARAGEAQLATGMAARLTDRTVALGYELLAALAGQSGVLTLPDADGNLEPMAADGLEFTAGYRVDERGPSLVRLTVTVGWKRPGTIGAQREGTLSVVRYVADPARAIDAR